MLRSLDSSTSSIMMPNEQGLARAQSFKDSPWSHGHHEIGHHRIPHNSVIGMEIVSEAGQQGVDITVHHSENEVHTVVTADHASALQFSCKHLLLSSTSHQSLKTLHSQGASIGIEKDHTGRRHVEGAPVLPTSIGRICVDNQCYSAVLHDGSG